MDPVDLATLLRSDRDGARQALDSLSVEAAAQLLSELPSRDTWRLIFLAHDPQALVRALPKGTFFTLFHDVGAADAGDLLPLASHEQVEFCLDLECWQRGELVVERVDEWLMRLAEAGERTLFRQIARLDFELLLAMFAGRVRVTKRHEDVDPVEMDDPDLTTFDDLYYVALEDVEGARGQVLTETLRVLRSRAPELAVDLLEALRQELPSAAVEDARRLRDGRVWDEGLPDFDCAMQTLARLDVRDLDSPRHRKVASKRADVDRVGTELVAVVDAETTFLVAALAGLAPAERAEVEHELAHLTNTVLVGTVCDFADLADVRRKATHAVGCLGIGLEHASHGRTAEATELVRKLRLDAIFRVGRTLVSDLVKRAERLADAATHVGFHGRTTILGHVVAQVVDALRASTPTYPRALDDEGEIGTRWLESLADLRRVDAVLARGEAVAVFLFDRLRPAAASWDAIDLADCTATRLSEISAHQAIATLAANLLLGNDGEFAPIDVASLPTLRNRLARAAHEGPSDPPRLSELEHWLEPRIADLPLAVTGVVRRVVDEAVAALLTQLGAFHEHDPIEALAIPTLVIRAPGVLRAAGEEVV